MGKGRDGGKGRGGRPGGGMGGGEENEEGKGGVMGGWGEWRGKGLGKGRGRGQWGGKGVVKGLGRGERSEEGKGGGSEEGKGGGKGLRRGPEGGGRSEEGKGLGRGKGVRRGRGGKGEGVRRGMEGVRDWEGDLEGGKGVRRGGEPKERRSVVHDKKHSSFSLFDRGVPDVIAPKCWKKEDRWNMLGTELLSSTGAGRKGRLCLPGATAPKQGEERHDKARGLPVPRETHPEGLRLGWLQGPRQRVNHSRTSHRNHLLPIENSKGARTVVFFSKLIPHWNYYVTRVVVGLGKSHQRLAYTDGRYSSTRLKGNRSHSTRTRTRRTRTTTYRKRDQNALTKNELDNVVQK